MPVKFKRTLIIGLGGIGGSIVTDTYKRFLAGNPSEIEKRNAYFLALDTDEKDIKARREILPPEWVIKTSSDLQTTVAQYIQKVQKRCRVKEWFDMSSPMVLNTKLNAGAAQVRMTSRLAMMAAIDEGKLAPLGNCVRMLLSNDLTAVNEVVKELCL